MLYNNASEVTASFREVDKRSDKKCRKSLVCVCIQISKILVKLIKLAAVCSTKMTSSDQ
jgi:hypothetical protein